MNNEPVVSVIIPVYNMEHLVEKCINSILDQTYQKTEIIIVDDGSTDRCGEIVDAYALRDKRVKVYHHEINKGIACGFKTGIDNSHGDYILFVDSDNYIHNEMVESLVNIAINNDAEIVQCEALCYTEADQIIEPKVNFDQIVLCHDKIVDDYLQAEHVTNNLAAKLFDASLFCNLIIPEGHQIVDTLILPQLICNCKKYICISQAYYFAYQAPNSISRRSITEWRINDLLFSIDFISNFFTEHWNNKIDYIYFRNVKTAVWAYNEIYLSESISEKNERLLYFRQLFKNNYLKAKQSIYFKKLDRREIIKYALYDLCLPVYNKLLILKFRK